MAQPKYINNNPYPIIGHKDAFGNSKEIISMEVVEGHEYARLCNPKMLSPYIGPRPAGRLQKSVYLQHHNHKAVQRINKKSDFVENTVPTPNKISNDNGNLFAQKTDSEWVTFGIEKSNLLSMSRGELVGLAQFFGYKLGDLEKGEIADKLNAFFISKQDAENQSEVDEQIEEIVEEKKSKKSTKKK